MDARHGGKNNPKSKKNILSVKVITKYHYWISYCTSSSTTTCYIFDGESSHETNQGPTIHFPIAFVGS